MKACFHARDRQRTDCNNRTTRSNDKEPMGILRTTRLILTLGALIIVGACSSAPRFRPRPPVEPLPPVVSAPTPTDSARNGDVGATGSVESRGDDVVKIASNYLGVPYRTGGESTHGVDCSGLACVVYRSVGIKLPRTSDDQARVGAPVSRDDLEPGDLVFFGYGSNVSHVGIYAGDGNFIHASDRARSVRFDRLDNKYFRKRYVTARRVL
jgi:cell wall-associated NlpC family hydrolase